MKLPSRLLFGMALVVPALALAGCIQPELIDDIATGATEETTLPPTAAVAYTLGANGLELVPVTTDGLLPDGLPLPVGASRYSPTRSFEPTVGVTSDGTLFLSSFAPGVPAWTLLSRSKDQGVTWEDVTPKVGGVSVPPQSNDPYVFIDPDTDRIFLSDLQALVCATLSYSDDGGDSWVSNPVGCGQPFGVHDHQTVFTAKPRTVTTVGYDNVVYYCINRVVDSACATSLNGGITFGPLRPLVYPGVDAEKQALCGGLHAHGAASADGIVYLPKGQCGVPTVSISKDDGLTWKMVKISDVASPGHEVAFAVDEAGNAYALWISSDRLPYLATSADGGMTWNDAVMVAPPGVMTTDFPTITAGADGRIALAYYGTTADKKYAEMTAEDSWNAYLTVVTDVFGDSPVFSTVTVNDPADPVARGVCGGTRCNGVGDFIDVVIDAEGRPWVALVDVCTVECAKLDGTKNDNALGFVGTLAQGPALRGDLSALKALLPAPVA